MPRNISKQISLSATDIAAIKGQMKETGLRSPDLMDLRPGGWQSFTTPEAPSQSYERMHKTGEGHDGMGPYELWENSRYYCCLRRYAKGFFIKNSAYIVLGISATDETACHDWRDFQAIKNDLCGRDWEGIELYPAESRLKDPSNRFYLWCVPRGILKFGLPGGRMVLDADEAIAPQRPFPREDSEGGDFHAH